MSQLPPDPQVTLKRVYPWDEYNKTLVMQWLYAQAQATGFTGTFEDFKSRYGASIEAQDPADIYTLIENYKGTYHIKPLVGIEQILQTKNKVLNQNIIIESVSNESLVPHESYSGTYVVTPLPNVSQILRTADKVLKEDITINEIPIHQVDNNAGGRTVTIV